MRLGWVFALIAYAALSEGGNPTIATLMLVMKSLGLRLGAEPVGKAA